MYERADIPEPARAAAVFSRRRLQPRHARDFSRDRIGTPRVRGVPGTYKYNNILGYNFFILDPSRVLFGNLGTQSAWILYA